MGTDRRGWMAAAAGLLAGGVVAQARAGMAGATFEVFVDARKEYRWRLKASNGKVIADSGEGYKNRADCLHGIDLLKTECAGAKVVELETKS